MCRPFQTPSFNAPDLALLETIIAICHLPMISPALHVVLHGLLTRPAKYLADLYADCSLNVTVNVSLVSMTKVEPQSINQFNLKSVWDLAQIHQTM